MGADSPGEAEASAVVAAVAENARYRGSALRRLPVVIQFGEVTAQREPRLLLILSLSNIKFLIILLA